MFSHRPLAGVRYLLPAAEDYKTQLARYRATSEDVGRSFAEAVDAAERLARANPRGFAIVNPVNGVRAVVLRRFPFRLFYLVHEDVVVVVGVAHTAMDPERFLGRA